MTTNEEMLLHMINGTIHGIEMNIENLKLIPQDYQIPGFDDGKLVGYTLALNALKTSLGLYHRWCKGEMPGERIEAVEQKNLPENQ